MQLAALLAEHWPAVKRIYEEGIATGQATFQTSAPSWDEWDSAHFIHSRLVALKDDAAGGVMPERSMVPDGDEVMGWAALTPVSGRCVYAGVAEVSVYVDANERGKGVGRQLLQALIQESEACGIWTLQAGIFPENIASVRLHEVLGFRLVGHREKIGKMGDRWRDTLLLERRSQIAGV